MIKFRILFLNGMPIWEQLKIEEALLRADQDNWCIVNTGSPDAIVMGISGKPESLLDLEHLQKQPVPVIKRFSGGGTVYIDSNTVFATFICNAAAIGVPPQPKPILKWSSTFYQSVIQQLQLKENDYVIGERKCGGNAQYLQKERWLHHTSFLWDFSPEKMRYLLLPQKRPEYRKDRTHGDFLCSLSPLFSQKERFIDSLVTQLESAFELEQISLTAISEILSRPHRRATTWVNY